MRRPNRYEAARDPSAARRRLSAHRTVVPVRTWSLPLTTVLRAAVVVVALVVAVTFILEAL